MYTIVDLEEEIRGTDGYSIGPYVYYSQEDYDAYLKELEERVKREKENDSIIIQDLSSAHVSYRNRIELNIIKVK